MGSREPFYVIIPARFGSTRLPGKPLLEILGKPMIRHVYENALSSGAERVIVATDDERIAAAVDAFGGNSMLTDVAHVSGTDRIAEVARRSGFDSSDIVVNLQGDEPRIGGTAIAQVAELLTKAPDAGISTLAAPICDLSTLLDPNVVKVVTDDNGWALYFSRAPIPWSRDSFASGVHSAQGLPTEAPYLRHIGIYGYRVEILRTLSSAPPRPIERAESLEQLRAMAMGIRIRVGVLEHAPGHGVDTPEDLLRVAAEMRG